MIQFDKYFWNGLKLQTKAFRFFDVMNFRAVNPLTLSLISSYVSSSFGWCILNHGNATISTPTALHLSWFRDYAA